VVKTYIVAGDLSTGTTMLMAALMAGGIPGLHKDNTAYEWPGHVTREDGVGKVVKRFWNTVLTDISKSLDNLYIVYMLRDPITREKAHPTRNSLGHEYNRVHLNCIATITRDQRVARLVCLDFDFTIDHPLVSMTKLKDFGWKIDPEKAASAINPKLRHVKTDE